VPKVLYLLEQAEYGGAELGQLPVMKRDPDPLVACAPGSPTQELAERHGLPTVALDHRRIRRSEGRVQLVLGAGRVVAGARDLRRILRQHPDREIVYCLTARAGLIASLAAVGLRRRLMWHVTNFLPRRPLGTLIRLVASATATTVVPHSDALKHDFAGRSRRLLERSSTIYSGCLLEGSVRPAPDPGRPVAIVVGDISPTKRTDLAVEIARRVARERPDFRLAIVGRARYRDEDLALERDLRRRVESDPELAPHVEFRGARPDMGPEYAGAGLLLHCCEIEGFGIVVLEAMACGLPVVAPAAGGPRESVEHGVTGLLYEPGDPDAAARCVLRILADRDAAARMGAAGRRRYHERFSLDLMVGRTNRVLAAMR
jgi:glycosyltransferase involved in cell wall biosynthesis